MKNKSETSFIYNDDDKVIINIFKFELFRIKNKIFEYCFEFLFFHAFMFRSEVMKCSEELSSGNSIPLLCSVLSSIHPLIALEGFAGPVRELTIPTDNRINAIKAVDVINMIRSEQVENAA